MSRKMIPPVCVECGGDCQPNACIRVCRVHGPTCLWCGPEAEAWAARALAICDRIDAERAARESQMGETKQAA